MKKLALIAALLLLVAIPMSAAAQQTAGPEWHLQGTGPVKLIGGYGDNMVYDGSNVRDATGSVEMHLNSDTNTGSIVATFTVDKFQPSADLTFENAKVTLIYPAFGMPGGMGMPEYWEGGVADGTHLHGDTGQEAPIVPGVDTPVATWGPVMVFVNGKKLEGNPDMMGAFSGHMMYTERVRDPETQQLLKNVLDYIRTFSYEPITGEIATAPAPTRVAGGVPSFARDIMPIFLANCVRCHSDDSILGSPPNGLKLTGYEEVMRGSSFLPVVVPGKPNNSPLILMTRAGTMPADSDPLPSDVIQKIADWIAAGAPDN